MKQVKKLEQSTEEEVKHTFSSIVGQGKKEKDNNQNNTLLKFNKSIKRKASAENAKTQNKKRKNKESEDFRDKEFYIPYSRDEYAERG